MAKKFSLVPAPTFKAAVTIQVPGGKSVQVEFVFKHRSRDEFKEFVESMDGRKDVEILLDIASGWELEDAFGEKSLQQLVDNYMGAGQAVVQTYMAELTAARAKN
jgi:hypothetical protein